MRTITLPCPPLLLREVAADDLPAIRQMIADPEQVRYIEFDATESSACSLLDWALRTARDLPRSAYALAVTLPPDDRLIGVVSCVVENVENAENAGSQEGRLGIILHRDWQGKGLARNAMRCLLVFGFEQLRLRRMYAGCHPDNQASVRLLEHLGMRRTAENERVIYTLLKQEWTGNH